MKDQLSYYMNLDYPIEICKLSDEMGGGFEASIPLINKWAFSAIGDTITEALNSLEDIKKIIFTDMISRGKNIPLPPDPFENEREYSGNIPLRISKELHKEMALKAEEDGISLNRFIERAMTYHIAQNHMKRCYEIALASVNMINLPDNNISSYEQKFPDIQSSKYRSKENFSMAA